MSAALLQGETAPLKRFSQKLINTKTSVFTLPIEQTINLKGLVIADQHFGKTLPVNDALPRFFRSLVPLIVREQINCLFMLGDIVHVKPGFPNEEILEKVFAALEQLPIPVYVMGGGLDRTLIWDYKYNKPNSNVKVVYDYAIKIHHPNCPPGSPPNIYLSHDLCNPLSVKPDEAESFVVELKRAFSDEISSDDYLIIGHVHEHVHNDQARCVAIKEYSQDNHRSDYAIVSMSEDVLKVNLVAADRKHNF